MKTCLAAFALAATLATPATAVTFPSLTTIYVGAGVADSAGAVATSFTCSNVSGVTAQVRWLVLSHAGTVMGNQTVSLGHGATLTVSTHPTPTLFDDVSLDTGPVTQGVVNIESTQSGVFCTAVVLDLADVADGYTLPLVRVNPHPGTVE